MGVKERWADALKSKESHMLLVESSLEQTLPPA